MAANELARHARVSPSYISLIEKGAKVPSGPVALRIAKALNDDPRLYLAWVSSSRVEDVESAYRLLGRARWYRNDPRLRERVESGQDVDDLLDGPPEDETIDSQSRDVVPEGRRDSRETLLASSSRRRMAKALFEEPEVVLPGPVPQAAEPGVIRRGVRDASLPFASLRVSDTLGEAPEAGPLPVPVLRPGADPGQGHLAAELVEERIRIEPSLLGRAASGHLFAYRLDEESSLRVRDRFRPGDLLVLAPSEGPVAGGPVYAVRHRGRILLGRLLVYGRSLLLLPAPEGGEAEALEIGPARKADRLIAGRVVLSLRREP